MNPYMQSFIVKVVKEINPYCNSPTEYFLAIKNKFQVDVRQQPELELRLFWIWQSHNLCLKIHNLEYETK